LGRRVTGEIRKEVLDAVLDALPVEISFVDENDVVRYFNKNGDRIFPRPPAVIGRKVQDCHPKKSLHKVNQILEDFKANKRSSAEFWIDLKGRKIYIRYFAVRGKDGKYLGCLEVSQDITDIQKIKGEKRLL
jgi:PAS domain S-box-containing protein